jgi:hypothetical protein
MACDGNTNDLQLRYLGGDVPLVILRTAFAIAEEKV